MIIGSTPAALQNSSIVRVTSQRTFHAAATFQERSETWTGPWECPGSVLVHGVAEAERNFAATIRLARLLRRIPAACTLRIVVDIPPKELGLSRLVRFKALLQRSESARPGRDLAGPRPGHGSVVRSRRGGSSGYAGPLQDTSA